MIKYLPVFLLLILFSCQNQNESEDTIIPEDNSELFNLLKEKDSLLFQIGFNQIDTAQVAKLASEDFEFYHDKHGITESKDAFVDNINGIRDLTFKTWRTLVEGSLEVFPLYKDNKTELYGAIQNGTHEFYQQEEGEEARKSGTARFTHLWILENEEWKLKRVFSFDHQLAE